VSAIRTRETIIIGAGQAGLALSRNLARAGHEHVLLERGRVGERWRSQRWDSLSLLTPNWLNGLPGSPAHRDPDGFLGRQGFVEYLDGYARSFAAPVLEGVNVLSLERARTAFRVETDGGRWWARNVVVATGYSDEPRVPRAAGSAPQAVLQLHSSWYRSPDALPPGGVLVVGAGPSGQQIAAELRRSGRSVVLAVGRHVRSVRRYRGRDIWAWLAETGDLDRTREEVPEEAGADAPSLTLTGANGGEQLDLDVLRDLGVVVAGRLRGFSGPQAIFAGDLGENVAIAERRLRRLLERIDGHIEAASLEPQLPAADPIREVRPAPGPRVVDLQAARVSTVIWATGYRRSYPWLDAPVLGGDGEIAHSRGVTGVPGLYALGLRFQHKRKSHFIGGVGEDAAFLADHILHARSYLRTRLRAA
jgi:putative flavoprotein involved in K+ transport